MAKPDQPLTLEQLTALNDELAAIVRMGVPLELGLRGLAKELPGRVGDVTQALQQRVAEGQDLADALHESVTHFPPAYRAIIRAGLESGRLPTALECVAESARRVHEVRYGMRIACFYPLLVLTVAYAVFVLFVVQWVPGLIAFHEDSSLADSWILTSMSALSDTVRWWAPSLPVLVALPVAIWWLGSRRSVVHPLRGMQRHACLATFADLLASMIDRSVPLHRALQLAGEGSGSKEIRDASQQWVEQLERGEVHAGGRGSGSAIPDWIVWLLQHSQSQSQLARHLHTAARGNREIVLRQLHWLRRSFPVWVTILLGGTVTALTAVLVAGPWLVVLMQLTEP